MFGASIATAFRNFLRPGLYNFVNIGGLAVGLTCAIFIALFLRDEISYDRWISGSANIYRVEMTLLRPGRAPLLCSCTPYPVPLAMRDHIPGVNAMTRLLPEDRTVIIGERQFDESISFADPDFFQVIPLPLIAGNAATVLARPDSVVLSQSVARKYFGDADPIGKTITISASPWTKCSPDDAGCKITRHPVFVSGVLKDLPHNTHFVADLIMPNTSGADGYPQAAKTSWQRFSAWGYVSLAPGTDPAAILAKLKPLVAQNVPAATPINGTSAPTASNVYQYRLTNLRDVHLTPAGDYNMKPPGDWSIVYAFSVILILILLVACFNFTNLATAQATLRAREVALRKSVGASRAQLITQFLGESILIALASLVVALALVEVLQPLYNNFLARPIRFDYLGDWQMLLAAVGMALGAGIAGGIYPAIVLSRFRPAAVLRANTPGSVSSSRLRSALVVAQFAVSIGLGIAAAVVSRQVDFEQNMDFGFRRDHVVVIWADTTMTANGRNTFADILRKNPGVEGVTLSRGNAIPFGVGILSARVHAMGSSQSSALDITEVDPGFFSFYGMRLFAGRALSADRGEDVLTAGEKSNNNGHNIMVNEAAARALGFSPQEAIGKNIIFENQFSNATVQIVGVLADTRDHGAREIPTPMMFTYSPEDDGAFSVRLRAGDISKTLAAIDDSWRAFVPGAHIERYFLDDEYEKLYHQDEQMGVIFRLFVGITIFIAGLGLFGLASFAVARRTRETGIRKAFGAGTADIVRLLLWQFSIPVLLANAIAWPIAYYYLHRWLETYAYRISLDPLYFLGASMAALLIALLTVSGRAILVARQKPIAALRYE